MPQSIALPGSGSLLCPFFSVFEPLRLMASFVREISCLRQARPSVSLNIKGWLAEIMHHNSYRARIARIIVLVDELRLSQAAHNATKRFHAEIARPTVRVDPKTCSQRPSLSIGRL